MGWVERGFLNAIMKERELLYEYGEGKGTNGAPVFSVSEFVEYVNIALGQRRVSVSGEISGYRLNQGKWVFFDLKDTDSTIGCFAASWNLHAALEDGMEVVVHGFPRVYGKSGKFSITVDFVELKGEGALRRAFELTKKTLEHEGLFTPERKRPLPQFPEKIGIIASRESAAYTDFLRIINARMHGLEIFLYHVRVQGEGAVGDIVRAFEWFNERGMQEGIESLALVRGGGSLEDLQAFNSESVARAVFGSRIPVICGVGHERDESLADYAADVRAATPTHAASLIVPDQEQLSETLCDDVRGFQRSCGHFLEWYGTRIRTDTLVVHQTLSGELSRMTALVHAFSLSDERVRATVDTLSTRCSTLAATLHAGMTSVCAQRVQLCTFLTRTVELMNPLTLLKRGYTIVKRNGTLVARRKGLRAGDRLTVTFADGVITAEIQQL